ncbi:GTP cyclohydrolase I FolE [Francisella adeliensis]|uniref:GTP cyclohydrolase 1 n=1 Tax=Francisella adeliensis TaxID=2007306 RepID=A0A2Z4XWE6_9GAMM|nr:GTP cyclohydrolase I FolE [Francisella adeliensis]AXA33046.1 GTP cyclohydrolase I FolE [Francisella adeliensis]MBK2086066.1 GTP cyclohydrolase I FolE [Francisella adeliensis]MBK2096770.1 GTP cyclohydrolase I FolE [Francisella adeliensis]QIW11273.1 GTP cyclohydrolase I FolE [Francisella adeliensis]QIW13149.1 GTP cyclohydrolase I FolE [Francisella adeliensis]
MDSDKELGLRVRELLISKKLETPLREGFELNNSNKIEIEKNFESILYNLGLDLENDSLKKSPKRIADMYINELFKGLDYNNFPKCSAIENNVEYNDIVIEKDITTSSTCEHHFVMIDGFTHIGYIPNKKIIGLSKFNRITDFFATRPQVQERLTRQIFETLKYILETEDVAVVMEAKHNCVRARGIKDYNSTTITSAMGGAFMDDSACRKEFMDLVRK